MDRGAAGMRTFEGGPVQAGFEEAEKRIMRRSIRPRRSLGRHTIGAELSYYSFPERRIVRHMVQIRPVEHDAGRRRRSGRAAVVASDTVSINHSAKRGRFAG